MSLEYALRLTQILLSTSIFLQSVELLSVRSACSDGGIWSCHTLRDELSVGHWSRSLMNTLYQEKAFTFVIGARALVALMALFSWNPCIWFFLLLSSLFVCIRFRGSFNGGSDFMTVANLLALSAATIFQSRFAFQASLTTIAIQSCMSYMIAGWSKITDGQWRSGRALKEFLNQATFESPAWVKGISAHNYGSFIFSWFMLIFECLFPFVLLHPNICAIFLIGGAVFHLTNAYLLGLNRFFFAWIATYPSIIFISYRINWLHH